MNYETPPKPMREELDANLRVAMALACRLHDKLIEWGERMQADHLDSQDV